MSDKLQFVAQYQPIPLDSSRHDKLKFVGHSCKSLTVFDLLLLIYEESQ